MRHCWRGVHHYGLVGPTVGLFGLAIVSLGTMVLSLFHGPLLAVMGLSGAYLVPLLIGGDDGSVAFVLSYSFLITVSSLMLMRYVYRDWLWYATLSGAFLWWLATSSGAAIGASTAWYIAALFVVFAMVPVRAKQALPYLRGSLDIAAGSLGAIDSRAGRTARFSGAGLSYCRPQLWCRRVVERSGSCPGPRCWSVRWGGLGYVGRNGSEVTYVTQMAPEHQGGLLSYLIGAAILSTGLGLWHWVRQNDRRRWASFTLLSPLVWAVLGWLLIHGHQTSSRLVGCNVAGWRRIRRSRVEARKRAALSSGRCLGSDGGTRQLFPGGDNDCS